MERAVPQLWLRGAWGTSWREAFFTGPEAKIVTLNRALAAWALLCALPAAAGAQAVTPPAPAATATDSAEPAGYREAIQEAVAEYDAGRYAEARALFTRAHALAPSARTLRGLGMAEFELRNYVVSARMLEEALVSPVRPLEGELRAHTEGLLARARGFVGRFTLQLSPPNTQLMVDGAPAVRERDGALALSVGDHTLQARADGYATVTHTLSVHGGEQTTLNVTLQPQAALTPTPAPAVASPSQPARSAPPQGAEPRDESSSIFASPWLWVAVGVVVVGAGVGVGLAVASSDAEQADPYGGDTSTVLTGP
jgi:hypothetical protein